MNNISLIILLCLTLLMYGCAKEEETERVRINSFSFDLDGEFWKPSEYGPCYSSFICRNSRYNGVPLYTIRAYNDSVTPNYFSKQQLRLRIFDVSKPGKYPIDGTYKSGFDAYALYENNRNRPESQPLYVNSTEKNAFFVEIDEIIPIRGSSSSGIRGSFYGVLYNETNQNDSIVIENGEFIFRMVNYSYDQCETFY